MRYRVLQITWVLALVLALYVAENLWVDAWLRAKFAGLPMLVPEALGSAWLVVFVLGGIVCVVLIVGLVLVSRNRRIALRRKVWTGIAVVTACTLLGWWFRSTSGVTWAAGAGQRKHAVTLT